MLPQIARYFILIMLITSIVGCTTTKTSQAIQANNQPLNQQRNLSLANLNNWELSGKVAAITANDSGSASLDWTQHGNLYNIALMGPLGSHAVKLQGRPGRVTMETSDGKHISAPNAETLIAQQMGWRLPVSNLHYWIRGLAVPNLPQQNQFDNNHRLLHLVQDGWNVQYLDYQKIGAIDLPERINISSSALKVKIVIYKWRI